MPLPSTSPLRSSRGRPAGCAGTSGSPTGALDTAKVPGHIQGCDGSQNRCDWLPDSGMCPLPASLAMPRRRGGRLRPAAQTPVALITAAGRIYAFTAEEGSGAPELMVYHQRAVQRPTRAEPPRAVAASTAAGAKPAGPHKRPGQRFHGSAAAEWNRTRACTSGTERVADLSPPWNSRLRRTAASCRSVAGRLPDCSPLLPQPSEGRTRP